MYVCTGNQFILFELFSNVPRNAGFDLHWYDP